MASDDLTDVIEHAVPLAELISSLRRELAVAVEQADDLPGPKLEVVGCDVELQIALKKAASGKGGVKFWVLEAGAERTHATEATHTIRLQLKPRTGPIEVSGKKTRR